MNKLYPAMLCFFLLYVPQLSAQYDLKENSIWVYGDCSGLDFNSGVPVPIQTGVWGFGEANASVCDTGGRLLFYTNGTSVWDRSHVRMAGGYNLTGITSPSPVISPPPPTESTTQGGLIVAVPGSADRYYIFSLSSAEWGVRGGRLYYSIVDMRLNNGMGDIVSDKKGILVDTRLTEHMAAVPGDNCNVWLLVHSLDSAQFRAYEITAAGIAPQPVVSSTGISRLLLPGSSDRNTFYTTGALAASPDRRRLAAAYYASVRAELYDFDPATGRVSNTLVLDSSTTGSYGSGYYGVCFSPDNTKLYAGTMKNNVINQFDLSMPAAMIAGTRTAIGPYLTISKLRLAPDRKIYLQEYPATSGAQMFWMAAIAAPDALGTACQYTPGVVQLLYGSPWGANVFHTSPPDPFVKPLPPDTAGTLQLDTLVCTRLDPLTLYAPPGYRDYEWDDGSTGLIRTIHERGIYHVQYSNGCHVRADTFVLRGADVTFSLGNDTVVCGDPVPLTLSVPVPGAAYRWQDGSSGPDYTATASGSYHVRVEQEGCAAADTIRISFVRTAPDLGADVFVCRGTPADVLLHPDVPEGASAVWNDGHTEVPRRITDTGTYWLTVSYPPCSGSDTVHLYTELCDCSAQIPTAFSPNGDGRNDRFRPVIEPACPVYSFDLSVYNRWGQAVWHSNNAAGAWDGTCAGANAEAGVYMYIMKITSGTRRRQQVMKGDLTLIR